jgi:hypothetical protein
MSGTEALDTSSCRSRDGIRKLLRRRTSWSIAIPLVSQGIGVSAG